MATQQYPPSAITVANVSNDTTSYLAVTHLDVRTPSPGHSDELFLKVPLAVLVYSITLPIFLVVGTLGNCMIVAVLWYSKALKTAFNAILVALALSDQIILLNVFFSRQGAAILKYYVNNHVLFFCVISPWVWYAFDMCSAYLLVVLSLQRSIAVIFPHYVSILCTRRKSFILIGCVLALSMLMTSPALMKERLVVRRYLGYRGCYNQERSAIPLLLSCNQMVVVTGVPFCTLLVSNALLSFSLMRAVASSGAKRQKQASSTTVTVIVLSFVFLVSSLPVVVAEVYHRHGKMAVTTDLVTKSLKYVNHISNFYLYCLTATKFREDLRNLLNNTWLCVCRRIG